MAQLVATLVFQTYNSGRVETIQRWLGWFEERGLVERYPTLAVAGAWAQTLVGRRRQPTAGPTPPSAE